MVDANNQWITKSTSIEVDNWGVGLQALEFDAGFSLNNFNGLKLITDWRTIMASDSLYNNVQGLYGFLCQV